MMQFSFHRAFCLLLKREKGRSGNHFDGKFIVKLFQLSKRRRLVINSNAVLANRCWTLRPSRGLRSHGPCQSLTLFVSRWTWIRL